MSRKEFEDLQFLGTQNRNRYLSGTDWYTNRFVEQNTAIPREILDRRQEARGEISELRDATTYEEIEHLGKTFS